MTDEKFAESFVPALHAPGLHEVLAVVSVLFEMSSVVVENVVASSVSCARIVRLGEPAPDLTSSRVKRIMALVIVAPCGILTVWKRKPSIWLNDSSST